MPESHRLKSLIANIGSQDGQQDQTPSDEHMVTDRSPEVTGISGY